MSVRPLLRLGADALGDYASFTDESSISGHRYMLLGGISCRSHYAQVIQDKIAAIRRASEFPTDSLQWKHYRDRKWPSYKQMVDFFLEENSLHRIDFSCVVIDTSKLDHKKYNEGDGETFFQKTMYQLYISIINKYDANILRGFHGRRESPYEMFHVQGIINSGIARKRGNAMHRPLRQFEYMDVERSGPHQLTDTLLGAVSFYWNSGLRRSGESRKTKLANYISAECCASSLGSKTPMAMSHFDIWEMKLKVGGPPA